MSEKKIVYLEYEEEDYGGHPESNERYCSRSDRHIKVKFKRLYREKPSFYCREIELSDDRMLQLDHLFLAVVRYSDGDTFGQSYGHWDIVGVAPSYPIAKKMLEEATIPAKEGDYKNYRPWEGYFASLEDTEVEELSVW